MNNVEDVAKLVREIGAAVMRPDEVADVDVSVAVEASICVLLSVEVKMICLVGVRFDLAVLDPDDIVDIDDVGVVTDIVVSEIVTGEASDGVGFDEPVEMVDVV